MAFDFPNTPSVGAIYAPAGGPKYKWDGQKWVLYSDPLPDYAIKSAFDNNLIVNPCFHVSQQNGTAASTANGYYPADQWFLATSGLAGLEVFNEFNQNDSGSVARLAFSVTTAKPLLAASNYTALVTRLEGTRVRTLNYHRSGFKTAQAILRFMINAPAGTYTVALRNAGYNSTCFIAPVTISAGEASMDVLKTIVVPAPIAAKPWMSDTSAAIEMWITMACGTDLVAPATGWQDGGFIAAPTQTNLLATQYSQMKISDVALYADPLKTGLAPAFEVPDYDDDLRDSMRYWQRTDGYGTLFSGNVTSGTGYYATVKPKVPLRGDNPVLSGLTGNQVAFPTATGTLTMTGTDGAVIETRVANATGGGMFRSQITFNARM